MRYHPGVRVGDLFVQIQDGQRRTAAHHLADDTPSHVQGPTPHPGLAAAIRGPNTQQVARIIQQHERRRLHPKQSDGMAYHALENLVEIETGGDVAANFDQCAQLFLLPQKVAVERAVV